VVRSSPLLNEAREWWNRVGMGYSIGQVLPKGDPELSTGPLQAHEGISTASPQVTSGPAKNCAILHGKQNIPLIFNYLKKILCDVELRHRCTGIPSTYVRNDS
jgi:hypothetical protein